MMVVHEPPRRVLIPLPHSKVALSDYLFPGEGPSEALVSIADLIGVQVSEAAVCKDFEGQPGNKFTTKLALDYQLVFFYFLTYTMNKEIILIV